MKRLRNEKGAITLITLITILFLISFLMTSYVLISNKVKTQKEILSETKKIYEPKITMEDIYNSYFTNNNIIPIYTVEQLLAIGNNETINIYGKIYTFSNTEDTAYLLKNDLEFNANELNLEGDWIPPYENTELLANFDWSGHTIKVTKLNGDVITYDGTYIATVTGNSLTLTDSVKGKLLDYKIYGNSVQNGTPTPETPVEIKSVGDKTINLFNKDTILKDILVQGVNGTTYTREGMNTSDYIKVGGAEQVSISLAGTYAFYNSEKVFISGENKSSTVFRTYNVPTNAEYIRFSWDATVADENQIMLVLGEYTEQSFPEYEPYNKYKIPIKVSNGTNETTTDIYLDEPLRKAGAYVDYIDFEAGNVVREVKERQVTSSTTFYIYTYPSSKFYGFAFTDSNMIKGTRWDGFCSHLPNKTKVWFSVNNTRIYISLNDIYNSATTDNERKVKLNEWLDSLETPFIVQFPATLPEEPIKLPDISILKGTNKIEIDTQVKPSNISVTYNAKQ